MLVRDLLFERLASKKSKMTGISLLLIFFIINMIGMPAVFAAPTVTIQMEKTVYAYGEKLFYVIVVSEVTGEPATIYIRDEQGGKSSGIPIQIIQVNTPVPSTYPFERQVFPIGKYFIDVEYSGASDSIEFELTDSGNIVIPFWIKQVAYYWISDQISDKTFSDAIEFLIKNEIIKVPETVKGSAVSNTQIPTWIKTNTTWWLEEKISDADFALGIQYLIKVGIIVV